jgi:hypothetical protein
MAFLLALNLIFAPPTPATLTPSSIANEMITDVKNGVAWIQEYTIAVIGLTMGVVITSYWLKSWK